MQTPFQVEMRTSDSTCMLVIAGELDLLTVGELEEHLDRAWRTDAEQVILDLRALEFMDSTGLSAVVLANKRAQQEHRRFSIVVEGAAQVNTLFSRTGVRATMSVIAPEDLPAIGR